MNVRMKASRSQGLHGPQSLQKPPGPSSSLQKSPIGLARDSGLRKLALRATTGVVLFRLSLSDFNIQWCHMLPRALTA